MSLLIVSLAMPLLLRFYIRATIGYQQLQRFNRIRNACWAYLSGDRSWGYVRNTIQIYEINWKSPERWQRLFWGSAKYHGFVVLFGLYTVVFAWAFVTASGCAPRVAALLIWICSLGFEGITLFNAIWLEEPSNKELKALEKT